MNFKKNKLIILIIASMLIGVLVGFIVNKSLNDSKYTYDREKLNKIENVKVRAEVEKAITKYEETTFRETKKNIAGNYSILSDIFLSSGRHPLPPKSF